jgi:DnaK suppressor protein
MNVEHYRQLLLAKEKELVADVAESKSEVKEAGGPEVQDEADLAVSTEEMDTLLSHGTRDSDVLEQVRDALKRIDDGTYGSCLVCGRPIEEKRLEAVPWAAYDLPHQAEVDKQEGRPVGGATI